MGPIEDILERLRFARTYSLSLVDATPESEWGFRQPMPGLTHLAWQIGHMALAEYGLCLAATRGARPSDVVLLPPDHRELFGRGTKVHPEGAASANAPAYPSPAELRARLDRVHEAVLAELPELASMDLSAPTLIPFAIAKTKIAALRFCPEHEMLHAGQIGLLRRMLGHASLR